MVIESKSTPQEFPDIEPGDLRARFGTPQKLRVSVIQMSYSLEEHHNISYLTVPSNLHRVQAILYIQCRACV